MDSALAGRYDEASLRSAPCSLPASEPVTAMTISQNTTTSHLVRFPHGHAAIRLILLERAVVTLSSPVRELSRARAPGRAGADTYDVSRSRATSSYISKIHGALTTHRPGRKPRRQYSLLWPPLTAETARLAVLHVDKDFELIAEITGQETQRLQ